MRQAKNLYLRQDVILGRTFAALATIVSPDTEIRAEIGELRRTLDAIGLIRFLRAKNIVIECHPNSLRLDADPDSLCAIYPTTHAPSQAPQVPRQRVQQHKHERGIANS
jgi:hypothetical protein